MARSSGDHVIDFTIAGNLSLAATSVIEGNLLPDTSDSRGLGDATHEWADLYVETLHVSGSGGTTFTVTPSSISFSASVANFYSVTTGSSTITATLPTAVGISGQVIVVKKVDSGSGLVSIATTSAQTIDGNSTYQLTNQWQFIWVMSDGSNWQIISGN